ncbi:DUF1573 domain-containing protein [Epilithonimonas arachidiradicis]|uniref:Uncharacterized protein DUF1573 n=1 Tax=Epilithonimonas arachidiradicis TaxID=1617282 RepID=A0A420D9F7_9FLAO|nr:DUF1573 domain-containing protein [Epilithonimonas arachidiradicis]RKE87657.1 uncharacterized protein DUF1573 [Epilithonimonas arachidiradicis]GGG56916.1 hypothetical protein GCM10007332_18250 [Epilithonimonas arachidiradicis]
MKKILAGLFMTGAIAFASAQTISFDKTTFDYGNIKAGSDGHRFFTVKNTGDKPLILSEVKPSCGCTQPEWSKDPILPGKTAQIKVGYNTGIKGPFNKLIEVYSNDPQNNRSVLYIKGNVEDLNGEVAAQQANLTVAPVAQAKAQPATAAKRSAKKAVAAQKIEAAK